MCTMYWTIKEIELECPVCNKVGIWELQTHFMGDVGSCLNYYKLGEKVLELKGIKSATLDGRNDDFIGICSRCDKYINFGAKIKNETIEEILSIYKEE